MQHGQTTQQQSECKEPTIDKARVVRTNVTCAGNGPLEALTDEVSPNARLKVKREHVCKNGAAVVLGDAAVNDPAARVIHS